MALRVYERYLAKEIYSATFLVLGAFLGLFAFFDLIQEMPDVGKQGYLLQHALGFVALTLPGHVYEIMPIAALIGSLYSLTLLSRHSEITVLRASGLPTGDLLKTLAKIGAAFVIITLFFGEIVAPPAERAAKQLRLSAMSKLVAQEFRSGLWVKDGASFINVREVLPNGSLRGVRVYAFDDKMRLQSLSEAAEGVYLPAGYWRLSRVKQTRYEDDGNRTALASHDELDWQSALNPDILSVLLVQPERMSMLTLYQYIRHLSENRQKTDRYEIALWKKLIYPLATLVMMALAVPFAYAHSRMSPVSAKVFGGVMLGVLFHMLNGMFAHLGTIHSWQPVVAAIAPSVMFLMMAGAMLWWVERR